MRRALLTSLALALASGCASIHLRRLLDEDRVKHTVTLSDLPDCVDTVTLQLVQGNLWEGHEVVRDGKVFSQLYVVPFDMSRPLDINVWIAGASGRCPLALHARLHKRVTPAAAKKSELALSFLDAKPEPAARVPGGPVLAGEPGGAALGRLDGLESPPAFEPAEGAGKPVDVQLAEQKDAVGRAEKGTTHLFIDYPWQQAARGVYWLAGKPPPDPKRVRGADVLFLAETDCQDAAWYQYAQRKVLFLSATNPNVPVGQGFIQHDGRHEVKAGTTPAADEGLPYPHQKAGGPNPAIETLAGVPILRNAEGQDTIDTFNGALGEGRAKFPGAQRMRLESRFWTYLICRAPYQVVGHFEWGADASVTSVRDEPPYAPSGLADPAPEPKWFAGP
jgi:hypothetical protein